MQEETCIHAAEILIVWKNPTDQQLYAFIHLSKDVAQTEANNSEKQM